MKSQRARALVIYCVCVCRCFFFFYHYARQNVFKRYYYGLSSLSFLHAFSVRACSTAVLVHPLVFQPERHFRRNSDCARVYNIINYLLLCTPILFYSYVSMSLNQSTAGVIVFVVQPIPRAKNLPTYVVSFTSVKPKMFENKNRVKTLYAKTLNRFIKVFWTF